jgi:hypothetical protein
MPNQFEKRIILYVDILGMKEIIKNKGKNDSLIEELISFLNLLIGHSGKSDITKQIAVFSDSFAMSTSWPEDSEEQPTILKKYIESAAYLQKTALLKGFLLRGGITIGELKHEGNLIVGDAIIEAHEIEKDLAIYPRIVLPQKVVSSFKCEVDRDYISKDFDGINYVNLLGPACCILGMPEEDIIENFKTISSHIINAIEHNSEKERVLSKWKWLEKEFNAALDYWKRHEYFQNYNKLFTNIEGLKQTMSIHHGALVTM